MFALESENKRLTRALVREVGEEVPLSRLLDEGDAGDWKGRREQIIALREQVRGARGRALWRGGRQPAAARACNQAGCCDIGFSRSAWCWGRTNRFARTGARGAELTLSVRCNG